MKEGKRAIDPLPALSLSSSPLLPLEERGEGGEATTLSFSFSSFSSFGTHAGEEKGKGEEEEERGQFFSPLLLSFLPPTRSETSLTMVTTKRRKKKKGRWCYSLQLHALRCAVRIAMQPTGEEAHSGRKRGPKAGSGGAFPMGRTKFVLKKEIQFSGGFAPRRHSSLNNAHSLAKSNKKQHFFWGHLWFGSRSSVTCVGETEKGRERKRL